MRILDAKHVGTRNQPFYYPQDKKLRDKLKEFREEGSKKGNERTSVKIIRGEIVREVNGGREVLFSLEK